MLSVRDFKPSGRNTVTPRSQMPVQAPVSHQLPPLRSQKHPWSKYDAIVAFDPYEDRFGVMRDAQTAKPQTFRTGDRWSTYNLDQVQG